MLAPVFLEENPRGVPRLAAMAKNGTIHVLLVRSGATEWDDAGRAQGETDLPLCPSGRERLAAELSDHFRCCAGSAWSELDGVLHAPDEASRETAAILATMAGARTRELDGLRAMNMGLWEGLRDAELLERHPTAYQQWLEDPTVVTPPDGESLPEAEERLLEALRKGLARRSSAAVVLRPPAFGLLRCWLLGRPATDLWKVIEEAPCIESFVIERSRLKELPSRARARA